MTGGPLMTEGPPAVTSMRDGLLDGAIAGLGAALVLVAWWTVLDLAVGSEPTTLAWIPAIVLGRATESTGGLVAAPRDAATGVLLLVVGCVGIGAAVGWLLSRLRHAPTVGVAMTVSFAVLQLAFFAVDWASGADLFARLKPWSVLGGNALAAAAMTVVFWKRRPHLIEGRRDLWDDEP
ncbi:MAG: hypothetical protein ACRENJ_04030 [Candidatus Eiseniibacteriota bacterium]